MRSTNRIRAWRRVPIALAVLAGSLLVGGCSAEDWPVLLPDGPIALIERELLYTAVALMLLVIIPVYLLAIWVLLRYRALGENPNYMPNWQSGKVDAIVWLGPAVVVVAVGTLVWDYTHRLDPYKLIASSEPPLEIEVVAQDWKWLFIYPGENVAVVNELVIPVGRPVTFRITSDTVMNSFYVAGLAGQIYAMAGMESQLNLIASKPGTYIGRNTQYSGGGFPDQQFAVKAVTPDAFTSWLGVVRQSPDALDEATYKKLAEPSKKVPVAYFASTTPGMFDGIIESYTGPPGGSHGMSTN